jgi:hypothetical protein
MAWTITALIGNALRFVRRGTRLMPRRHHQVRACYEPAGPRVVLEVQDDGSGIRQQTLSELPVARPGSSILPGSRSAGAGRRRGARRDVQLESSEADRRAPLFG